LPRPRKWRCIGFAPNVTYFKPKGVPACSLEEVGVSLEEAESLRLRDLEGLEQEECAKRMKISRPTFHRILTGARKKVSDALLNGKAIRIEGGDFGLAAQRFRCKGDGQEWQVPFEIMATDPPDVCPKCKSSHIEPLPPFGFGYGNCLRLQGTEQSKKEIDSAG